MWYWGHGGVDWWGWLVMSLGIVVFWGLIIWLIVSLVRGGLPHKDGRPPRVVETPEAILKRRFADGEIDEDEFRRRIDVLRGLVDRETVDAR